MTGLWRQWIWVWCAVTIALGLALAGAAVPATDTGARFYYGLISGLDFGHSYFEAPGMRFTCSVLGAVLVGWGVTIIGYIRASDTVGSQAWRMISLAMAIWFLVDSALSIATGFPLNAAANTVFLVTYLVPVLASGVLHRTPLRPAAA